MTRHGPTRRALLFGAPALAALGAAASRRAAAETEDDPDRLDPPALPMPRRIRLSPTGAPSMLSLQMQSLERTAMLRFTGAGGAVEMVTLRSWYGHARVFAVLPLRGREVVLAAFEGVTGTGVYQEIAAIIGREDAGALRILGLETLRYRTDSGCDAQGRFTGRFTAQPDGAGLRYDVSARGLPSACPPRRAGAGWREEFGTTLRWSGAGVLALPVRRGEAGRTRMRVETARARAHAWLRAAPRLAVTLEDLQRLRLMETLAD